MRLVLDARTAAFASAIDTATGLDPRVAMAEALGRHRDLGDTHERWAIGMLVCPTSRLEELAGVATSSFRRGDRPVAVSVAADVGLGPALSVALDFQQEMAPALEVARIELGVDHADDIEEVVEATAALDPSTSVFIRPAEVEPRSVPMIRSSLREAGRTGGIAVADMTSAHIAAAVWEASYAEVPIIVSADRFTAISTTTEGRIDAGVINVILAAAAADSGESRSTVEAILGEIDPGSFTLGAALWGWQDITFPGSAISRARVNGLHAITALHPEALLSELASLDALGAGA